MKLFKNVKHKSSTKSYKEIIEIGNEIKALYDEDKVEEIEDIIQKEIIKKHGKNSKVVHHTTLDVVVYHYNLRPETIDFSKFNETEKKHLQAEVMNLAEAEECYRLRHKDVYPKAGIVYRWSNKAKDLVPYKKAPPKSCKTKKNKLRNNSRNKTRK